VINKEPWFFATLILKLEIVSLQAQRSAWTATFGYRIYIRRQKTGRNVVYIVYVGLVRMLHFEVWL
jgi:hypothetical protein